MSFVEFYIAIKIEGAIMMSKSKGVLITILIDDYNSLFVF